MPDKKESMSIFQLIPKIMGEINPIAKDKKNQQQSYSYRGVDQVMNELSPLLATHGVFPIMKALGPLTQTEVVSKNGGKGWHTTRTYEIFLYGPDGSSVSGVMDGEAVDYGDKSVGKCSSYAYRDFLLKTFVIPTAEPKDTDADSHELKPEKEEPKRPKATKIAIQKMVDRVMLGEDDNIELDDDFRAVNEGENSILEKAEAALDLSAAQVVLIQDAYRKHNSPE